MIDIAVALMFTIFAMVVLWLGRPSRMAAMGPNALVGMRTPATMRSSAAWAEGHRAAWPWLLAASVTCIVCMLGVVVLRLTGGADLFVGGLLIGGIAGLGTLAVAGAVAADKAAKRVSVDE